MSVPHSTGRVTAEPRLEREPLRSGGSTVKRLIGTGDVAARRLASQQLRYAVFWWKVRR